MYYEVLVSSQRYHGDSALTYVSESVLSKGAVVKVPLQRQIVLGIVVSKVANPGFATKQISAIVEGAAVPSELLDLIMWLKAYYPAPLGQLVGLLLPAGLSQAARRKDKGQLSSEKVSLPPLTQDQRKAMNEINHHKTETILLHGDTGTGKTRVYVEAANKVLAEGKSVIVLTPEIGLTPQLIEVFNRTFTDQVYLLHSNLTPAQRRDSWLAISGAKTPVIVIGPRSALFSPVKNIGLIVLDEVHDSAYKQEQAPYYQTTRVGAKLGELHKATVLFGSATPSVSDYYAFKSKKLPIIRMQTPAIPMDTRPDIKVIGLRERDNFKKSNWLSDPLLDSVSRALERKEQVLLFLNRRGTARLVLCQACGWQALCPRCDLPLTYHGDSHQMQCHTCGFTQSAPSSCPVCKATDIVFRSIGTKSVESELKRLFPEARSARFDSDSKKSERLESQYEALLKGEIDILVGTQMLGKGLDLPKLSVLGIVIADTSLYFPDYTAEEQTFQLLTQVMGRVHRGHRSGHIIIQTYDTENPVIQSAIDKDYDGFYRQQLVARQQFDFPPFVHALKLWCSRASQSAAQQAALALTEDLRKQRDKIKIIGPSPSFIEKKNGRFYWQLIVISRQRDILLAVIKRLPSNWHHDIDPLHLL